MQRLLSEDPTRFLPLLLVLLLAFLVPIVLSRFRRVPVVVGEIVAGMIIGPSLLGLVGVAEEPILVFMEDIGLAFLMFLAGIEIDFAKLFPSRSQRTQRSGPSLIAMAALVYLLTLLLAVPGGFLINRLGLNGAPWLLAFILSATSLGVLLPILKERAILDSRFGQLIFLVATLADFNTVILLTVYIITLDKGLDPEILSIGLLFLAFLILYRVGPRFIRMPRVRSFFEELSRATVQIKVRGAIAILMMFVVLAEFLDAELILGAFLAGMIISLLKEPQDEALVHKLEAFGFGFFIPIFFIMVGVSLDLGALAESPESLFLLPLIFAVSILVKGLPLLSLTKWFPLRQLIAGGLLLDTHLSLTVAVAVIGLRAGLFDAATSTTVILFAELTVLFMPIIFGALLPDAEQDTRRFMLLVGVNETGIKVAQELRAHGDRVRFLESASARVAEARRLGFEVIEAAANTEGLDKVDFVQVETVLTLSEDEPLNLAISRKAKALGQGNVVALVQDPTHLPDFQRIGVQPFTSAIHRVTMIAMMARNPDTYTLLTSTVDNREIMEMSLYNPDLAGSRLRDLQLPGDYLVLAVRRNGEMLIPRGKTVLEYADRLTLVGDQDGLSAIREWLEGRSSAVTFPSSLLAGPNLSL